MPIPFIVHDPYRNIETTLKAFADAEGVPKHAVSHYFWYHKGSLEGFRDRPKKGEGNGLRPHIYTKDGKFVHSTDAAFSIGIQKSRLVEYRKRGITDLDEIARLEAERKQQPRQNILFVKVPDGRVMDMTEFAKEQGVSRNSVYCYWRYHNKSLEGYDNRGGSRVNPNKYRHDGMGVEKTAKEWAQYFNTSVANVRMYLRTHNLTMNDHENRSRHLGLKATKKFEHNGEAKTIKEWAAHYGVSYAIVQNYKWRKGSLVGIDEYIARSNKRRGRRKNAD